MNGLLLIFLTLAYVAFGQDCEEGVVKKLGKKPRLLMKCLEGKWIAIEGRGGPGAPPCQDDPALAANGTCEKDRAECLQYSQRGQQLDRDCPGTCGSCDKCACRDSSQWHKFCHWWAQYCDSPGVLGSWMTSNCRKTCKKCSCKCCSYQGKQHQLGAEILLPEKCGKLVCREFLKAGPSPLVSGSASHKISHPEELTLEFIVVQEGANCCLLPGPAISEDGNKLENGTIVEEGWKGNLNTNGRTLPTTCCHGVLSVPLQDIFLAPLPPTTTTASPPTTSTMSTSTIAIPSTSPACGQGDVTVVSGNTWSSSYSVQNLITHENKDIVGNYWLGPEQAAGTFILNMGCALSFDAIRLVNTHNAGPRDRGTRQFRLFTSMIESGPWTQVLDKELEDSRRQQDPLPLQIIALDTAAVRAQFVKFEAVTWWGRGSGLQYFDIQRD